jgi:hypothetical protein
VQTKTRRFCGSQPICVVATCGRLRVRLRIWAKIRDYSLTTESNLHLNLCKFKIRLRGYSHVATTRNRSWRDTGGELTEGGLSCFGLDHGWTCDNLRPADSSVVTVTEQDHIDIFHGFRGGGKLCIVTRVDFVTAKQGPLWFATIYDHFSAIDNYANTVVGTSTRRR